MQDLCNRIERNPKLPSFIYKPISVEEVKNELEKISDSGSAEWGKSEWIDHSPLFSAVKAKRNDVIDLLVKDLGFDIDSVCKDTFLFGGTYHYSALSKAIENNDEDMVRFLVDEMNATVNINYCRARWPSPLVCAVELNKFQIVKLLVEELGADVNFKVSNHEDESGQFLDENFKVSHIEDVSSPFLALHSGLQALNTSERLSLFVKSF